MVGVLRHSLEMKWVTVSRFAAVFHEQYDIELDADYVLKVAKTNPRFGVWEPDGEEPQIRGRPRDLHHGDGAEA